MQQGRGGIGSRKHGISGHATKSPRLRLMTRLAAERGELARAAPRRPQRLSFASVGEAMRAARKPRRR